MKKFKTLAEAISKSKSKECNENKEEVIIARFNKVKNEYGEFVIKFYENGVRNEYEDYYTDDWQDALDTAKSIAQQYKAELKQKSPYAYVIVKENINEDIQEEIGEEKPKSINFNGKVLNFSAVEDCDFCGRKKWVGITQFGSTHYNRLICKDCAEEAINYYKKAFNSDLTKLKEDIETEVKENEIIKDENIPLDSAEIDTTTNEIENNELNVEMKENTFADVVTDIKNSIWDIISNLNGLVINTQVDGCPNKDEVNELLNQITDDETVVIGMLEKVSELISEKRSDLIQKGKDKAEELLNK